MKGIINAFRDILMSLDENKTTILIIIAIAFILAVIVKILYKIANRNQEILYEQSLKRISIERRLQPSESLIDKLTDFIIKFIVIAVVLTLLIYIIDYCAGLMWED